ncbi:CaiB/BaiF CoA transferase family protein [Mycolicibacterium bacteremicum]|uniref:Formyl-CoA transferase n=1 Tax=Mycolicibacterium bacteremicum TaxID=564198 RepID=A0A1W9Z005_MYCBA|nr:CaiB/BaiF CoA-transferase family protein [Mycolicibacterium bacteremicum]MCV7435115.1 CoA transferase [Mycolicibacterium bacteremicum]ORA05350.1 formyl-CoA transferase [Mycolicibacterium bacteremicum]
MNEEENLVENQNENVTASGPLVGIRVVEMGQLIAGPFCGQLLGDLGADVIKLEDPSRGDPMREWGHQRPSGESLWWSVVARNKRSVTCNLRSPEGQDLARRLIRRADIVVENFRPGTMEKWGLGYDELAAENPGLIMVRVSGFGQSGPYSGRAGFGAIGEAMGGLRYVVGDPSNPPSRNGISIGDSLAATYGTLGALAALHDRSRTGLGQVVDSAIYEAVLAMMESLVPEYQQTGYVRERTGAVLPNVAPSNVYPTSDDSWVLIAANQNTVFGRLAQAMGQPGLAQDPRFATHGARGERQAELDDLIAQWTRGLAVSEVEKLLEEHGVPCGQIYRAPEMLADEHYRARQSIIEVSHDRLGPVAMQNVFPRLTRSPGKVRWVGPSLGSHTDEVLTGELGLTADEVARLREAGVA